MILETQISSKYSPDNPGVFTIKNRLASVAVATAYPKGDQIIFYTPQEFAITTPDEARTPFDMTQLDFFREIKSNGIHVVYNAKGDDRGYLGESASVETAYALALGKPIMLFEKQDLHFGERVNADIADIIERNKNRMDGFACLEWGIEAYGENEVADYLYYDVAAMRGGPPQYDVTEQDRKVIMHNVLDVTRTYRKAWNAFQKESI